MTQDASSAIDLLEEAAQLNSEDSLLRGSTLVMPDYGQVVMTGDMHGHRRNFEKLQRFCRLQQAPVRHVMLHELIHDDDVTGPADMSHELLLNAVAWKIDYPDQVHFLQSNHELAELNDHEITKGGRSVLKAFRDGVAANFGDEAPAVLKAIHEFIRSLPLAARTANRIMMAHTLPAIDSFLPGVLDQPLTELDLSEGGLVSEFCWGRPNTVEQFDHLAELFDVDCFVLGHQPQDDGAALLGGRAVVLASEHNHGAFLPFDLKKPYTPDDLIGMTHKFVAVP